MTDAVEKVGRESGEALLLDGLRTTWSDLGFGLARVGFGVDAHATSDATELTRRHAVAVVG
jgi:hypothetical protein